jgi:hypothetical protein
MGRVKYVYNNKTLQYEKLETTPKDIFVKSLVYTSSLILTSAIIFGIAYMYFPTPKEKSLEREISQMEYQYSSLTKDFENLAVDLESIHNKDSEVHRMIFGMEAIDSSVWEGGTGGHKKYPLLTKYEKTGDILRSSLELVDKLKRKVEIQKTSLDEVYEMAVDRDDKLSALPSIKPVREDKLKRKINHLSGFGIRIHPVHKVKKFHKGIDFTAPKGTPIQATGDGVVKRVEKKKRGYGRNVTIDHGYGYETLYAHMATVDVKKGEKVKRGQQLGTVGSTGTSTAPHLHYEVRINGKCVNPIDYCMDGLTPREYKELVLKSSEENQSFD